MIKVFIINILVGLCSLQVSASGPIRSVKSPAFGKKSL